MTQKAVSSMEETSSLLERSTPQTPSRDMRRCPKVLLGILSMVLFGCAFIASEVMTAPLYDTANDFPFPPAYSATGPDTFDYPPVATLSIGMANMQACIDSANYSIPFIKGGTTTWKVIETAGGCSEPISVLTADLSSYRFEISGRQFQLSTFGAYFLGSAPRIIAGVAIGLVAPLLLMSTVLYLMALLTGKEKDAIFGAALSVVAFAIGLPIGLYALDASKVTDIDLSGSAAMIHQSGKAGGAVIITALTLQMLSVVFTCCCCCSCFAQKADQRFATGRNPIDVSIQEKSDGQIEIYVEQRYSDFIRYDANAKSTGVTCCQRVWIFFLGASFVMLYMMLFLIPTCAYMPQLPGAYTQRICQNNRFPGTTSASDCNAGSVCVFTSDAATFSRIFFPLLGFQMLIGFFSPVARLLRSKQSRLGTRTFMETLRKSRPQMWFKINCYRVVIIRTERTDSYGHVTVSSREEKTLIHSATDWFKYSKWFDATPPIIIPGTRDLHLAGAPTRVKCDKVYMFADEATRTDYKRQLDAFVERNRCGNCVEVSSGLEINGFVENVLVFQQDSDEDSPGLFRYRWHLLSSLFGMTAIYEVMFYNQSTATRLQVGKILQI